MPMIRYSANSFPPRYAALNDDNFFNLSWAELVWAAISVGRAELMHIVRHGQFSVFEIAYRTAILYANLVEDQQGFIRRSSAYNGLDPSEKGAISFFLGLTLTKAFSYRFLNVPWLMHLDVYREDLRAILQNRSKPDLVGQNANGEWVVMESKGRTNEFDRNGLTTAKNQARQVIEIAGQTPILNVGLQVHFNDGILQLIAEDPKPESDNKRSYKLPLSREKFIDGYYRPFREWLEEVTDVTTIDYRGNSYRQARIQELDINIGLDERIRETQGILPRFYFDEQIGEEGTFVATDGLFVRTGQLWSQANMVLEP